MKCPRCWSEKAYTHRATGWRRLVLPCLLLVPMKCHHCYEEFTVPWFSTFGKRVTPPTLRAVRSAAPVRQSYAARHYAASQQRTCSASASQRNEPPQAKAA